ncbi:hypothetical protein BX666DRAFT_1094484 [Dichotomocladium elegans]|nr:hypothetical protein BX666DRAFT_1094484 [Dichotomocladium elegans]
MSDKAVYGYPQREHPQSTSRGSGRRYMPIRKNACIVCGVCFTCSKYYANDCTCSELQPRRGKNLPEGTLDSRAKKLHPQDKDDYEFSLKWLTEHAHEMHKDANGEVVGLSEMAQVSLCKAHSSTLYRAQKKHERSKQQLPLPPPSICPPPEVNGYMEIDHYRTSDYQLHHAHPPPSQQQPTPFQPMMIDARSSLAAKARTLGRIEQYQGDGPDLTMMTSSTSLKRKRLEDGSGGISRQHSSASTPLLAHPYTSPSSPIPHVDMSGFPSMHQLPPLQQQQPPVSQAPSPRSHSSSVSSLPLRLHQFSHPPQLQQQQQTPVPPLDDAGSTKMMTSPPYHFSKVHHQSPPLVPVPFTSFSSSSSPSLDGPSVDTVSLKSTNGAKSTYYIRNLAITDTFTFRDLLTEVDMIGKPPHGKKIVISDERNQLIYPMDQAIRSVVRRPAANHVEFCLGLKDSSPVDWSTYTT